MDKDQISSSSDEFNFATLDEESTLISDGLRHASNESSEEDSEEVRGVRRRKIRIIDSESEVEGASSSKWVICSGYEEVPPNVQFIPGQNPIAPRIVSNMKQPIDFFKLFFTNDLVENILFLKPIYTRNKNWKGRRYLRILYGEAGVM